MESLGAVIAHNSAAPLTFDDKKSAVEVLSALKLKSCITGACLFDNEGKLFARFGEIDGGPGMASPTVAGQVRFADGCASLSLPVELDSSRLGTLRLRARFQDKYRELLSLYGAVLVAVVIGSLLLIVLLSSYLQRPISGPIVALAQTAGLVAQGKDYSVRAQGRLTYGSDGLGSLLPNSRQDVVWYPRLED